MSLRDAELSKLIYIIIKKGVLNQTETKMLQDKCINVFSNAPAPLMINTNEYFQLEHIYNSQSYLSNSWILVDDQQISCINKGNWQIIAQYHLVNINSVTDGNDATIEAWFNVNNVDISNSCATSYVSKEKGSTVLTIALCQHFPEGTHLKFGLRSNSNNGVLNIHCNSSKGKCGINIPSFIATLTKID